MESPSQLANDRAPHIVTELPGPNARAVIDRDESVCSTSLTRTSSSPRCPSR